LRGEPEDGDIEIGGATTLAGEAAQLGLVDEFRSIVNPVVIGGSIPFYPQCERRLDLELIESRTQPVATHGNGFACSCGFCADRLATGCHGLQPIGLHRSFIVCCQSWRHRLSGSVA
jgi:RibD C-terminal domain